MKIFGKLFRKNKRDAQNIQIEDEPKGKTPKEILQKMNVDVSQASEKFQHHSGEILTFLVDKLQVIDLLEKEIFERSLALKNPEELNQVQEGEDELWDEFAQRRKNIISPISLKPSEEGSRSFGKPSKYDYLNCPNTRITFIMKSANRAVVEFYFEYGVKSKEQFVLKSDENNWKIDTKKYGFQGEDKWYKDEL